MKKDTYKKRKKIKHAMNGWKDTFKKAYNDEWQHIIQQYKD